MNTPKYQWRASHSLNWGW